MANPTMTLISSQTLGGTTASVTFSSIPATYNDLKLVLSTRNNEATNNEYIQIKFNSATTGYSETTLKGVQTTTYSLRTSSATYFQYALQTEGTVNTTNTFAVSEFYIPNYASATTKQVFGSVAVESNDTLNAFIFATAGFFNNSAAITSITLTSGGSASFVQYSDFYLYGIKNS